MTSAICRVPPLRPEYATRTAGMPPLSALMRVTALGTGYHPPNGRYRLRRREEGRSLSGVGRVVVAMEHLGLAAGQRRHDPAPVRAALPSRALFAVEMGQEPLGL